MTTALDYDAKGNLTLDQLGQRYGWDLENRLTEARAGARSSGYVYDALGRRLGKTALGTVTSFVHDGAQVISEYEAPVFHSAAIGAPALTGTFGDDGQGTVTLAAGGTDIWGTSDQFRYAYATLAGNGSITARITGQTNTNAWAKAGVMLRESLAADARTAALLLTPSNGVTFQRRGTAAGTTVNTTTAATGPVWLRLTRSGSTITAARSSDGLAWTTVGTDTIAFPATPIHVGLAVTSHNAAAVSTATITNVSTTGDVRTTASPTFVRAYVHGDYIDEPLALITPATKHFYHANHLYSVAALTDSAGAVAERYRYDAYGQRTVLAPDGATARPVSSIGNQLGFTGRYLDQETGLWYFRARYYSSSLGRFMSRDPLGYVSGLNLQGEYFIPNQADPMGFDPRLGDRRNEVTTTTPLTVRVYGESVTIKCGETHTLGVSGTAKIKFSLFGLETEVSVTVSRNVSLGLPKCDPSGPRTEAKKCNGYIKVRMVATASSTGTLKTWEEYTIRVSVPASHAGPVTFSYGWDAKAYISATTPQVGYQVEYQEKSGECCGTWLPENSPDTGLVP
jgi:RHS repeat-associated protein